MQTEPEKTKNIEPEKTPETSKNPEKPKRPKKPRFSGAYWYVDKPEDELGKKAFIRTVATIVAVLLQFVVLLLPQGGLEYVTNNLPSYAYVYMWIVFIMLAIAVFTIISIFTRYKFMKRIPVERAPKKGFKRRAFLGTELLCIACLVILGVEISFVCLSYDAVGLVAVFICAASLAAAVYARIVTVAALREAVLVPAAAG